MMNDLRKEIAQVCLKLYQKNYVIATSGNISASYSRGFLITPASTRKDSITPELIVECDSNGNPKDKTQTPSSEVNMHKFIYENRRDVGAAIHAHPPYCVTCTLLGISLKESKLPETAIYTGPSPTVPYATPGTIDQANAVFPYIQNFNSLLLERHGVLVLGKDLEDALNRLEQLEYVARVTYLAR